MGTKIRQLTQAWNSGTYTDTTAPTIAAFETNPTELETDLNNLRSAVNNLLNARTGNWYDDTFAVGGGGGGTADLPISGTSSLNLVPIGCFTDVLTVVTVGGADNWVILNVAGSEAPTVGGSQSNQVEGAIVADSAFSGAAFASNELVERTGSSGIAPNNLVIIRDSTTLQPLQSGGKDIMGLLQVESTFTPDGGAFDDVSTGNRVKISFVIIGDGVGTNDDLLACPAVDIQGQSIQYNYASIKFFKNIDPACFTGQRGYVDQAASVDVTLQNAYNNGPTIVTASATDIAFSGPDGGGGFAVATVDPVSVGTANATAADTGGSKLSLSSGDGLGAAGGGDITITGGDSGLGATGDGASVSVAAGSAGSTSGNGGDAVVQAGNSTGANQGGIVTLTAGSSATGQNGFINVLTAADEDEVQLLITPSGSGATVGLYSGASDPNGVTAATAGSLYMRSNGQVWVNTTGAMVWLQLSTGSVEDRQDVYDNGPNVLLAADATLTLDADGRFWDISDSTTATLFRVTQDTATTASTILFGTDVDIFDSNAVLNDFDGTTFNVDMSAGISLDAGAASNFNTTVGDLTLSSDAASALLAAGTEVDITAGTLVDINATTSIDIDAGTTVAIDTADIADASGNSVTITAGSSTGGTANGANIVLTPGDGFTTGVAGFVNITSPADQDEALLQLASNGTSGAVVQMFAGDDDPNTVVTANAGSLFMRSNGQLWINTDGVTAWDQLQAGTSETRQDVYDNGPNVLLAADATLTLDADGRFWDISDSTTATLFRVTQDTATTASTILFGTDVDIFDSNAVLNDFDGTTFNVDMSAGISLDAGVASNFNTTAGDLTLSSDAASALLAAGTEVDITAGTLVDINATTAVDIDAGTTVTIDTADIADSSGNFITINAGTSSGAGNAGAPISIVTGGGGTTGQGGLLTLSTPDTADTATALSGSISITTGGTPFLGSNGSSGNIDMTTGTGSDSSVQAGRIALTSGSAGAASGAIGGRITITAGSSDATGEGGAMGDVSITAGGNSGTDDAGDVNISTGANSSAGGAGGTMALNVGASTGAVIGSSISLNAGDAGATGATGGNVVVTTGAAAGGDAGFFYVDTDNDDDEHVVELSTGGTQGSDTQMLVGTTDPSGVVAARPSSLYFLNTKAVDGTPGELYLNVSDVVGESTVWSQVQTASTVTTFTYASGVASGAILATTDISDLAAASNITLDANSPSFPTFPATAALFFSLCKVWVNGLLQRNGVSATRSGTQSTAIQLNFALVAGDEVAIELRSA